MIQLCSFKVEGPNGAALLKQASVSKNDVSEILWSPEKGIFMPFAYS